VTYPTQPPSGKLRTVRHPVPQTTCNMHPSMCTHTHTPHPTTHYTPPTTLHTTHHTTPHYTPHYTPPTTHNKTTHFYPCCWLLVAGWVTSSLPKARFYWERKTPLQLGSSALPRLAQLGKEETPPVADTYHISPYTPYKKNLCGRPHGIRTCQSTPGTRSVSPGLSTSPSAGTQRAESSLPFFHSFTHYSFTKLGS